MDTIVRSLDDGILDRVKTDFAFLVDRVHIEDGELDLRLRDNYFNLYYKGNSLAKVVVKRTPYLIEIHKAFIEATKEHPSEAIDSVRFGQPKKGKSYWVYSVEPKNLHAFLSKEVITRLYRRIKERSFSEELVVEQLIIAANRHRKDFVIIDRQVQGGALGQVRVDILGLRSIGDTSEYNFEIVELKLGNNPELYSDVAIQLHRYVTTMNDYFDNFQQCYQRTYRQMKYLGLLDESHFDEISIVKPVKGVVVVAGYPGLARKALNQLQKHHPDVPIKKIRYEM